ncbi:MAG: PTS sugar transporter subunit IIC [Desulfuromonadales bacterium]|nr:PTS sugar transporter subunit IIC [Desulfuromonadales bacterium]
MPLTPYLLAASVSVLAGLDRTAAFQFMISRPIVAAPLTGWLLGSPLVGLQVGAMVELLWLGRLPIGAAIPPDDTQVAVGATALAIGMGEFLGLGGMALTLLAVLVALPIGKMGSYFERFARQRNGRLLQQAEAAVAEGRLEAIDRLHLQGLIHFSLASLATYGVILLVGSLVLYLAGPLLIEPVGEAAGWLRLIFVLVGTGVILGTVNVSRAMTLFAASFTTAFLLLWLR